MARILAIDYGSKRTGIAVTDELQIVPGALATVNTADLFRFLKDYFERENVERVIIGEPRQTDGKPSENFNRVQVFKRKWLSVFPNIPIQGYDERFTSVMAHRTMIDSGLHKKKRQEKAIVDRISATIILRDYLDSKYIKA